VGLDGADFPRPGSCLPKGAVHRLSNGYAFLIVAGHAIGVAEIRTAEKPEIAG
jgi:hypothetical protein